MLVRSDMAEAGALGAGAALLVEVLRADALVVAPAPASGGVARRLSLEPTPVKEPRRQPRTDAHHRREEDEAEEEGERRFGQGGHAG